MIRNLQSIALACVLTVGAAVTTCRAGANTTSGREKGRWTTDHYSVVVARVDEVRRQGDTFLYDLNIEPLAVIAGSLDASADAVLNVALYAGGLFLVHEPPPKGSLIMAVMMDNDVIVADTCLFMPDHASLVVLQDINDRRIVETLKRIQEARAHPQDVEKEFQELQKKAQNGSKTHDDSTTKKSSESQR